jgi:protein-S-isoprenylcysteine O-methyltransferase Ste14
MAIALGAGPAMVRATFCVAFLSLMLLGSSLVVTIALPRRRVWPPPSRASWQYWYTWGLTSLAALGITAVGILDWNTLGLALWLRVGGGFLALGGASFALWGIRELGPRATQGLGGELATMGPYRYSRNPQYVGDIAMLLGFGLLCDSALTLAAVAMGIGWFVLAPFAEEPWLCERLGSPYEEYTRQVPRFLGFSSARRARTR